MIRPIPCKSKHDNASKLGKKKLQCSGMFLSRHSAKQAVRSVATRSSVENVIQRNPLHSQPSGATLLERVSVCLRECGGEHSNCEVVMEGSEVKDVVAHPGRRL